MAEYCRSNQKIIMKKLPSHQELKELLEMSQNFEQQIKEQCDLAEKLYAECEQQNHDRLSKLPTLP